MKYILKNQRIDEEKNEYILFDDTKKVKSKIVLLPSSAISLSEKHDFSPVSPLQMIGKFQYREVSLSDIIPLPF